MKVSACRCSTPRNGLPRAEGPGLPVHVRRDVSSTVSSGPTLTGTDPSGSSERGRWELVVARGFIRAPALPQYDRSMSPAGESCGWWSTAQQWWWSWWPHRLTKPPTNGFPTPSLLYQGGADGTPDDETARDDEAPQAICDGIPAGDGVLPKGEEGRGGMRLREIAAAEVRRGRVPTEGGFSSRPVVHADPARTTARAGRAILARRGAGST
jgi:hypothetical protein